MTKPELCIHVVTGCPKVIDMLLAEGIRKLDAGQTQAVLVSVTSSTEGETIILAKHLAPKALNIQGALSRCMAPVKLTQHREPQGEMAEYLKGRTYFTLSNGHGRSVDSIAENLHAVCSNY